MIVTTQILDRRDEGQSTCFLCKMSLDGYVRGLPKTYRDYEVQREMVSNVYLDNLVDTVFRYLHIPPIVLVAESVTEAHGVLQISSFKILDGLQRTIRLHAIKDTIDYCIGREAEANTLLDLKPFTFSRQLSSDLHKIKSTTDIARRVFQALSVSGREAVLDTFRKNFQWFEIWTGLNSDQEVRKMLTLNAGHKPVKTRHQLELLFLNLLKTLRSEADASFEITRERETSATQFSKSRKPGSFHFAHIIAALLSIYEGKPVTPSSGLIQDIQNEDPSLDKYASLINTEFLRAFVAFLVKLDRVVCQQYPGLGEVWMGREVTLSGLFGALGHCAISEESDAGKSRELSMERFLKKVQDNPAVLNLNEFESSRNSVDLSKVNIGSVNRSAVYKAVVDVMEKDQISPINWTMHFKVSAR